MAKVVFTFEDVMNGVERGVVFAMDTSVTDEDLALPPDQVTPAGALGFAVRSLWRSGDLMTFARQNIDLLVEEAVIDSVLAEPAVKPNISTDVS